MCSRAFWVGAGLVLLALAPGGRGLAASDQAERVSQPVFRHAFSLVEGGRPRVFFINRERTLRLKLRNDGYLPWEPEESFNVSYHWLARSEEQSVWNGFRTRIDERVEARGEVEIELRVKMPPAPGLYRFQVDLVQEGVTWFSDRDPTPAPKTLAVVLPRLELFTALLLPTLTALVLWMGAARRTPQAANGHFFGGGLAELLWVGCSLWGKQILFYSELPRRFLPELGWKTTAAVGLALFALLLVPRRWRMWAAWAVAAFGAFYVWGQLLYYRFFADVATSTTFLATRQTGDLLETARYLTGPRDWFLVVDLIVAVGLCRRLFLNRSRRASYDRAASSGRSRRLVTAAAAAGFALLAGPLLLELPTPGDAAPGRNLRTLKNLRDYGLFGFQVLDLSYVLQRSSRSELEAGKRLEILRWFEERAPERAAVGEWAGFASGKNLVVLQVESMQDFVIGYRVDGAEITPTLNRFLEQALFYSPIQDQTGAGRSSAGDFVAMTSLLPVVESVAYEYPDNDYRALAHALADRGYATLSAIPYKGFFWNRQRTHPAYGFATNLFRRDFEPGQKIGWGTNDLDFLRQMIPRLDRLEEPFCAWLSTLSLHYPYSKFPEEMKTLALGELEGTPLGNYLHGMNLFDRAFGELLRGLEENDLLGRTVVALWGDHTSGLFKDDVYLEMFGLDDPSAERLLFRRVPFAIWAPGAGGPPLGAAWNAGQIDIAPTLLALMGVDPAALAYAGSNLLGAPGDTPAVHPIGWWVGRDRAFDATHDDASQGSCWRFDQGGRDLKPADKRNCAEGREQAARLMEASRLVLEHDLQAELSLELAARLADGNGAGRLD